MQQDNPTVFVGSRAYIRYLQAHLQAEAEVRANHMWYEAMYGPDAPTHFVHLCDGRIGMGQSYAAAFSDLVRHG